MIPTLEEIIRMLIAGECSPSQATAWLKQHEGLAAEREADDRRMFAAMAMQGRLASETVGFAHSTPHALAEASVADADALLAALATSANLKEPQQ
jgi:hypothetical protein